MSDWRYLTSYDHILGYIIPGELGLGGLELGFFVERGGGAACLFILQCGLCFYFPR